MQILISLIALLQGDAALEEARRSAQAQARSQGRPLLFVIYDTA